TLMIKRHPANRTKRSGHRTTKHLYSSNPSKTQRPATTAPSTVPGSTTHCHRPRPTKRNHHRGPSSGKRHANPGFSKRAVDQQHHLTGRGTNREHVDFYSSGRLHKHV